MSARQIAKKITEGKAEPQHLGKHTPETLTQELFSLKNIKPMFRDKKWHERFERISKQIGEIKDRRIRDSIKQKANDCLSGEC